MELVPQSEADNHQASVQQNISLLDYLPLFAVIAFIFALSLVAMLFQSETFDLRRLLLNFMTGFFLIFGAAKLLDLRGFADGYTQYDILAHVWRPYGYIYPFIEFGLGTVMLFGFHPDWLLLFEFLLMTFSGAGVTLKLLRREQFTCVCLGTFLKVPLTYVTLVEDFGMAAIALVLLFLV